MLRNKNGMTLGEVLITMSLMAFIAMIAIMTVKPFEKAMRSLYARAFEAIQNAAYNAYVDNASTEFFATPKELCEGLIEYMNTVYVDCNVPQAKLATYTTREFSNVPPHFIASNAMRVYISPQYEHTEEDDFGVNLTTKYYIVFIDLTGERPPNNANWTEEKPCDVVAFLVTDGADVVPLGPPEVDTRYVTATVSYPATIDNPEETFSQPMSYWDAKHVAWGNNVDSTEMMSLHFDRDLPASSPLKVNYPTPPALNEVKGCTEKTSPCDVVFEQYY